MPTESRQSTARRVARRVPRRWWPMLLAVPLGAAAGGCYAVTAEPVYTAHAYLVVVPQGTFDGATAVDFAQAYGRLVTQPQVLHPAAAEIGTSAAALAEQVGGTTSPDAPMIEISGTAADPRTAAGAANAVARSLVRFAEAGSKATRVRLVSFASAASPERPSSPVPGLDIAVGAAAGLLLGGLVMATRQGTARAVTAGAVPVPRPEATERAEPAQPAPASARKPAGQAAAPSVARRPVAAPPAAATAAAAAAAAPAPAAATPAAPASAAAGPAAVPSVPIVGKSAAVPSVPTVGKPAEKPARPTERAAADRPSAGQPVAEERGESAAPAARARSAARTGRAESKPRADTPARPRSRT